MRISDWSSDVCSSDLGKVGEHIGGQPVGSLLVEGAQNARAVLVAGIALQQGIGLFAAIATEVAVQQVHHSPQVAALFDIDLEQIAQVVLRWQIGIASCRENV